MESPLTPDAIRELMAIAERATSGKRDLTGPEREKEFDQFCKDAAHVAAFDTAACLTLCLAALEADRLRGELEKLNQMLRATGYGQGSIDSYVAESEENDRLRALLAECRPYVAEYKCENVKDEMLARIDAALATEKPT